MYAEIVFDYILNFIGNEKFYVMQFVRCFKRTQDWISRRGRLLIQRLRLKPDQRYYNCEESFTREKIGYGTKVV